MSRTTHGMAGTGVYIAWKGMRRRCSKRSDPAYKNYGGRGITYEDRWRQFKYFYEDMGDRPEGLSLDRIDNDGDYCKDNCRWATKEQQDNNRRSNVNINFMGQTKTLTQWSRYFGVEFNVLRKNFQEMSFAQAVIKAL